jgi:hypothetical protein
MIAAAERPITATASVPVPAATGAEARALALGYLRYASASWRGDEGASVFPRRLGAYWHPELQPAPAMTPDAVSPHGGGGRGIHWYEIGDEVLGFVPGGHGGYRVPAEAIPRLARCAPVGPA